MTAVQASDSRSGGLVRGLVGAWLWRYRELLWYALVFALGALAELWASGIAGAWGW